MEETALPKPTAFDVVFTGAGVSMVPPTALPSGAVLGAAAWTCFLDSLPAFAEVLSPMRDIITAPTASDRGGLRLEHLMGLLGNTAERRPLVEVYDLVKSTRFNRLHAIIAALPARVVTVNMDLLHEAAARSDGDGDGAAILHLHGDLDHEDEISTTIQQYLAGLAPDAASQFADTIRNKRVLVVGWGARDLDVIEVFTRAAPLSLHWIEHRSEGNARSGLSGPAESFLTKLEENCCSTTWQEGEALEILNGATEVPHLDPPNDDDPTSDQRARDVLARTSEDNRVASVNRVLFELSEDIALIRMVDLARRRGTSGAETEKQRARALKRTGRPWKSLATLLSPARRGDFKALQRNTNEISALLPRLGMGFLTPLTDGMLLAVAQRDGLPDLELTARARLLQRLSVRGKVHRAGRHVERVWELVVERGSLSLGNSVDAATWVADALKMRGEFDTAIKRLAIVADHIPYTNQTQSAWAHWKIAELWLLSEAPDASSKARDELDRIAPAVERAKDESLSFWVACLWADVIRQANPADARSHLANAVAIGSREPSARAYFHLIAASLEAQVGSLDETRRHVSAARRASTAGLAQLHSATLAGQLIELQLAPGGAAKRIRRARSLARDYEKAGMTVGAKRARVLAEDFGSADQRPVAGDSDFSRFSWPILM